MTFTEFFQENIILFVAGFCILIYLLFLELRDSRHRGINMSASEFTKYINDGAILIDLRSKDDFFTGHIVGARNIPMADLANNFDRLIKDKPIALYCYRGKSSMKAVDKMYKNGFTNVVHLTGGIDAWRHDNLPVVKD